MSYMKKGLGFLLAFFLAFGTLFSFSPANTKAYAKVNAGQALSSSSEIQDKLVRDSIERQNKLELGKFPQEFNDNKVTKKNDKISPDQKVRVIVELEGRSTIENAQLQNKGIREALASADKVAETQKTVINKVKGFGNVRHSYQNVINGFSVDVRYKDIDSIKEIVGVKSVKIANVYYPTINNATEITKTNSVWAAEPNGKGLKGEGTVVAIIDTGIDYTHKDMRLSDTTVPKLTDTTPEGAGKYFTEKVPYGYNFADRNQDIIDRTNLEGRMHGMHVAGIVAANAEDEDLTANLGVRGCAPEAQLLAMKVFSNNDTMGGAYTDDIVAAIEDSVKHGADVINMSLGSTAGFVSDDDPEQIAIKAATDAGVVVVISAGNAAYAGYNYFNPYTIDPDMGVSGSPGNARDAIEVASSENTVLPGYAVDYKIGETGETGSAVYLSSEKDPYGLLDQKYNLVDCGLGNLEDFIGKDLAGKIALIERGSISFVEKKMNAQAAGVIGVIVYNSEAGGDELISMQTDASISIPAIFIGRTAGLILRNNIDIAEVSFGGTLMTADNAAKGQMSVFTSWGTPNDLSFKPNITAPGGNIFSTVNGNRYQNMSGTSMASPHTAGDAALLVQYLRGKDTNDRDFVELAKKILSNTAKPIIDPSTGADNLPYLTREQGAGLINMVDAVNTNAYVDNSEDREAYVELKEVGDTTQFKFTIHNFGDKDLSFNVKDNYGVLSNAYSKEHGPDFIEAFADKVDGAELSFDKQTVTVGANGGTAEVTAILNVPTEFNNMFVEGFITLESATAGQPSLGIPYMGFHGDWDEPRVLDAPVWDTDNTYYGGTLLRTVSDISGYQWVTELGLDEDEQGNVFINPDKNIFSPNGDGYFEIAWPFVNLMRNAEELKLEVYDSSDKLVKNLAVANNVTKTVSDSSIDAISDNSWAWDGTDSKGHKVPDGWYDIKVSGKIGYEGAEFKSIDMPVRIDTKAPVLAPTVERIEGNRFRVSFNVTDDSDIIVYQAVAFDSKSSEIPINYWDAYPPNDSVEIELPNDKCTILINVNDIARNHAETTIEVDNTSVDSSLDFGVDTTVSPEGTIYVPKNSLTFNYAVSQALIEAKDPAEAVIFKLTGYPTKMLTELSGTIEQANLSDGLYNLSLDTISKSGKILGSDKKNFIIDTKAPEMTVIDPVEEITNVTDGQTSYTMQVRVKDISGYDLYVNDNLWCSMYGNIGDGSDTDITLEVPADLIPGENTTVTLRAVDHTGHEIVKEVSFTCDPLIINNVKAQPLILTTESGKEYQSLTVKVSGNLSYNKDNTTIKSLKINDTDVIPNEDGSFSQDITLSSYGPNTITMAATTVEDFMAAKNIELNISAINNYSDENNGLYAAGDHVFVTGMDTNIALPYYISNPNGEILGHMLVIVDSGEPIDIISPAVEGTVTVNDLTHAPHDVRFELYDTENKLISENNITLNVDMDEPTPTYVLCNNTNSTMVNENKVEITVVADEELRNVTIAGQAAQNSYGWYTAVVENLTEGQNRIEIHMEDLAGNINTFVQKVYVDTTPPVVDIEGYTDAAITADKAAKTYPLTITASDNVIGYMLYVDQNMIGFAESPLLDGSGTEKTFNYDYPLNRGINNIDVMAVDAYGHETHKIVIVQRDCAQPALAQTEGTVDKGTTSVHNIEMVLADNVGLDSIRLSDEQVLEKNTDYTVNDNVAALSEAFISALSRGTYDLTFNFDEGDQAVYKLIVTNSKADHAALEYIKVNGSIIPGFSNDILSYTVEVTAFSGIPQLTVKTLDENDQYTITNSTETIPGTDIPAYQEVRVVSQDGNFTNTYVVNYRIPLLIENLTTETSFKAGNEASVSIRATNSANVKRNASLILAVYEVNNGAEVLKNHVVKNYDINPGESVDMSALLELSADPNQVVKCFVWDSLDGMAPLADKLEFPVLP